MRSILIALSLTAAAFTSPCFAEDGPVPIADLVWQQLDPLVPYNNLKCAALRAPYVYVGDYKGNVYLYRLNSVKRFTNEITPLKVFKECGDGAALRIVNNTMLCTRKGNLAAYSLANPENPEFLNETGPDGDFHSVSLLIDADRAVVLGLSDLAIYDIKDPAHPKVIGMLHTDDTWWRAGCIVGSRVYASYDDQVPGFRGVATIDISDPERPAIVARTSTQSVAHGVHALSHDRLLMSFFDPRATRSEPGVEVWSRRNPDQLEKLFTSSLRPTSSTAIAELGDESYYIDGANVRRITDDALIPCGLEKTPSCLDGAPYQTAVQGDLCAIPGNDKVIIFQIPR